MPANSAVPVIGGVAKRANTLTTTAGTWSGPGNVYTYQCSKDEGSGFADITGATKSSYLPVPADTGNTLRVKVTATNLTGPPSANPSRPPRSPTPSRSTRSSGPSRARAAHQDPDRGRRHVDGRGQHLRPPVAARDFEGLGFADIANAKAATYVLTKSGGRRPKNCWRAARLPRRTTRRTRCSPITPRWPGTSPGIPRRGRAQPAACSSSTVPGQSLRPWKMSWPERLYPAKATKAFVLF